MLVNFKGTYDENGYKRIATESITTIRFEQAAILGEIASRLGETQSTLKQDSMGNPMLLIEDLFTLVFNKDYSKLALMLKDQILQERYLYDYSIKALIESISINYPESGEF